MHSVSFQNLQEVFELLSQEPEAHLDNSGKGGFTRVLPVTSEERLDKWKERFLESSKCQAFDMRADGPKAVIDSLLDVTSQLSTILCDDGMKCEAYFNRDTLQGGVRLSPQGACLLDAVDIPILQVTMDAAEPEVFSLQLSSEVAWGAACGVTIPALVAYWYARTQLSRRPAPGSCRAAVEQINYDIEHLCELGVGPGLAGLLLHCHSPILLWAELDYALETELPGLNGRSIDVAWCLHHPSQGEDSVVPPDRLELMVRPCSDNLYSFWRRLPPGTSRSQRIRLLDLCFASEGGDGPQRLRSVQLSKTLTRYIKLEMAPLSHAVEYTWRALLSRMEPQMDAVNVIQDALNSLGPDGVRELLQSVRLLGAWQSLTFSSDRENVLDSWNSAASSVRALREDKAAHSAVKKTSSAKHFG